MRTTPNAVSRRNLVRTRAQACLLVALLVVLFSDLLFSRGKGAKETERRREVRRMTEELEDCC